MKKNLLYVIFTVMFFSVTNGQSLWNKASEEKLSQLAKMDRATTPSQYQLFSLDFDALKLKLKQAPLDSQGIQSDLVIDFPSPEGKLDSYRVYEAPIMEAELANKYPDIKSYVGKGIEDPTATIRFSVTLFGLHTMTLSGVTGTAFIDTYTKDLKNYIVYYKSNTMPSRNFQCLVKETFTSPLDESTNLPNLTEKASDGQFRIFRLAMACTIEYAAYHVTAAGMDAGTLAQKKAAVLAAMNVTMTRVNGIYERDMSMRMTLVGTNDQVIFITSDNFSNDDANLLIAESQAQITSIIGTANFDIGHTVSTGGGGLAGPSPCSSGSKANGITGSPAPVGDPYDIDYVAHEMGHQFGANHTFAGDASNCGGGNRNNATGVEPGSGTTIMAYAGICAPQNVQSNSDSHFHAVSIVEMVARIAGTANCAAISANGNNAPVANAGADYTIPKGTAFLLKGTATDANGDTMTYCWEQTDIFKTTPAAQASSPVPSPTVLSGPNFRSFPPVASPNRYFPVLSSVVAGNLAPTWEVVPTVARTMDFALTVRDNRSPNGGQTGRDNMVVTVGAAGPFNVTSQASSVSWVQNTSETITWNVAGTTAAPYSSTNVNILLSTDNGVTFSTLLANTPNDGTQVITVPNVAAPFCKIMVQSIGNIFYAVNLGNIAIGYTVVTNTTCNTYSATPAATIVEQVPLAYQNFSIAVPAMTGVISDVNVSTNIAHRVNQLYIGISHPDLTFVQMFQSDSYACTNFQSSFITTFDDAGANFVCTGAAGNNTYKPASPLSALNGKTTAGNWRFRVADVTAGTSGTLNSYSFNICTTETIITLGTPQNYEFEGFALYPNPNNGNFTLQLKSNASNDINVSVHDLRGRSIVEKKYNNTGIFSQNIQLDNVQSGVYLVTISDGEKKVVKRIVIE
ncbi:reprolysin-like metallopeptidase [Flavobacterium sp.]|uniref:reprolysin-like metallopeptidase n=1 Tax=Flavobacterium sp. TaxID=239 RepID=UPI002636035D|nr:zinc-dependent metalloprotease family protein [Flavobacterium sp.]